MLKDEKCQAIYCEMKKATQKIKLKIKEILILIVFFYNFFCCFFLIFWLNEGFSFEQFEPPQLHKPHYQLSPTVRAHQVHHVHMYIQLAKLASSLNH